MVFFFLLFLFFLSATNTRNTGNKGNKGTTGKRRRKRKKRTGERRKYATNDDLSRTNDEGTDATKMHVADAF